MKQIIVLALLNCVVNTSYSQIDSLLLKNCEKKYEQKIEENADLKKDLRSANANLSLLNQAYGKDTFELQKQIINLRFELNSEKQKVSDMSENKIKRERDDLQLKIDSLNTVIINQYQTIADKDKQITNEKANAKTTADNAINIGKAAALSNIVNTYKNLPFDAIIKSSTKESVSRDMQLTVNNQEVKPVFNDLQIYFNVQGLLSTKFDAIQNKNAETQLSQIKRQSKLVDGLKDDIEFYKDFNAALKETIIKLVNLDNQKLTGGDSEVQKLKFNEIVTILVDYIYNYYDYAKYPYLSDIVLEIVKRKKLNADADITDLLLRL